MENHRRIEVAMSHFTLSLSASPFEFTGNFPGAYAQFVVGQPITYSITFDQGNRYYRGLSSLQAKCEPEIVNLP
jgi:hypothetical protein